MVKNHGFDPRTVKGREPLFRVGSSRQTKPNSLSHVKLRTFGVIPRSDARRVILARRDGRGRFQTKPNSLSHVECMTFGVILRIDARRVALARRDGRGRFQTKPTEPVARPRYPDLGFLAGIKSSTCMNSRPAGQYKGRSLDESAGGEG